jgi:chemotaxis protein MotB
MATSSEQHKEPPIRIVRKKQSHAGHHGGAWKVAYADFVTAMMALFIVLWIVGQSKQVKQYIANYFKDPGAFFENTRGGGMGQGPSIVNKETTVEALLKRQEDRLKEMGEKITMEMSKLPALKDLLKQVQIQIVNEGLRIELLEGPKSFFFDIGSSRMKPEAEQILKIIATEMDSLPNRVVVEGHTDSRQYARSDGYTNFELSADRANSARRILITNGLSEMKIDEVRGYADRRLRRSDDPFDVSNRRISIIIKYEGR